MRNFLIVITVLFFFSCKSTYEDTLKSRDVEKKEKLAFELYDKGDFYKASDLFKALIQDKKSGEDIEKMFFYYALCDYNLGDFGLAAYEFERLIQKFPRGNYSEESQFYIGMANYKKSPPSFLDQDYTLRAIESFQLFLDQYPNSKRKDEVNKKVDDLTKKLELKMYKQAKLFYKMEEYKSSSVFFDNLLVKFPDTEYSEEVKYLLAESKFKLAKKSIESKQIERYAKAIKTAKTFIVKHKESQYSNRVSDILEKSKEEIERLKKELPHYYHKTGDYDKAESLYETLLRRAKTLSEQQTIAVKLFKVHHTKCQKSSTQNKVSNYKALIRYYNDLSTPVRDYIDTKIAKEVESAQLGYQSYRANAAYQLYKEGKYAFAVKQYNILLKDSTIENKSKDWYFYLQSNYKLSLNLNSKMREKQLDSIILSWPKIQDKMKEYPSGYDSKIKKTLKRVESDLTEFPVALIKEPYQNGKYKVALGRAQNLLSRDLSKKDEEEIVYLMIAASVKHANKGKRFERFERFVAASQLLKVYSLRVENENLKVKLTKLESRINKGLIKYQIKEE